METQYREKSPIRPTGLIALPLLILAGLLLAPPTRSLLQAQVGLLFDTTVFAARLRDLGVREAPMLTAQKWEASRSAEIVAHSPDDYTVQLAGALLVGTSMGGSNATTPQERYVSFQRRFGERLTALALRFPNRPGPYAHLLRFMSMSAVRVNREGEAAKFQPNGSRLQDRQIGCAESWAAFDNAAAQGEKVDPDNAYFPLMRAGGLFDAKRDAEAISALLRAGQKSRFEDYSLEEPQAAWALYRRTYGIESAVLRESTYFALLLPHFSAIRSLARLTLAKAAQAERDGRPQDGLALRHAMMQCAVRMREQGGVTAAWVGDDIFSMQMQSPGGVTGAPVGFGTSDEQKMAALRQVYLAYVSRMGQTGEAAWVAREEDANTEVHRLIEAEDKSNVVYAPLNGLSGLWMVDMLLLANMSALWTFCGIAALCGRVRGGEKALPTVVLLALAACIIVAFRMQWAEALTQMRMTLEMLTPSYENSDFAPMGLRMSRVITDYPAVVHVSEVVMSLAAPLLTLIAAGATGLFRKEPFPVALSRGLRRAAPIFMTLLTAAYALALIATAHRETQANATLDGMTHNSIAYLQHHAQSGRKP